jgi:type III secretion system FlhB-like substrate exporter
LIRTIFTTVIVAVILNAIGHAGMAAWRHFQVRDQAEQLILFGGATPPAELASQIAQIAEEFEVPLAPEDVVVTRLGPRTVAEAYYTLPVELFPRFFYPVDLSFMVEAFSITGAAPVGPRR